MSSSRGIKSTSGGSKSTPQLDENVVQANLEAPTVTAIIDPNDPEGLVPTGIQNQDLEALIVQRWAVSAPAGANDKLEVFWSLSTDKQNVSPIWTVEIPGPVEDALFPYPIPVPKNLLQNDGKHELWYRVTNSIINVPTPSDPRVVTIDTRAPSYDKQLESLLYPADLNGNVITEAYLATHADKVELTLPLPLYTDVSKDDVISLFWSNVNPPVGPSVLEKTVLELEIIAEHIQLDLSGDDIRALGKTGTFHAFYKVRDRAGNETLTFSKPATATVSLDPLPVVLPAPTVPLHEDDRLLHRADARSGIKVLVNYFDDALPGDQVVFNWDGTQLLPVPAIFPISVEVPWTVLTVNGTGPRDVVVNYDVVRGGWSQTSLSATLRVDFSVAGQDHSGAPALLNPLLTLSEIRGQSDIANELIPSDRNAPVVASVELYQNPLAGQTLELFWGGWPDAAAVYTVKTGDVAGSQVKFSDVPWSIIDAEPNNAALPVYYTTSNGVNLQQSRVTSIKVRVVTIDDLPEPAFPDADKWGYINCEDSPWDGIKHKITFANNRFTSGDIITLFWQGYSNFNDTDPIPETYGEFSYEVNDADITNGSAVITVLPYRPHIEPIVEGSGGAFYTLTKKDGQFGTSPTGVVKIVRVRPGNTPCEPPFGWTQKT